MRYVFIINHENIVSFTNLTFIGVINKFRKINAIFNEAVSLNCIMKLNTT